jgi:hypothetical protein
MNGLDQPSLFSQAKDLRMDVVVSNASRYRILANNLPWKALGDEANLWRAKKVNIHTGRPLNLRLHLGALIAQSLSGWTDRETEEMVKYHAGVRLLCGLEYSQESIDHTNIESFRNQLGSGGVEAINRLVIGTALERGYTDVELCSSDTTVQESPIEYPTEVGHMKKISERLLKMAGKLGDGLAGKAKEFADKVQKLFTKIRLFARGKSEKAVEKKKKWSLKIHSKVRKMMDLVGQGVEALKRREREPHSEELKFYQGVMTQIWQWLRTGFHPKGKIVSLWERGARAISKGKIAKPTEFGRRWLLSIMTGGYTTGKPLELGAENDLKIAPEAITNFYETTGELPQAFVYDRGGDSAANHEFLKEAGVEIDAVFCKGKKSLRFMSDPSFEERARRMRATSEASIATIKHQRYKFNKPQAKSSESCVLKGFAAILGSNLNRLHKDLMGLRLQQS